MNLSSIDEKSFLFFKKGIQHLELIEEQNKKKNLNININFIKSILDYCTKLNTYAYNLNRLKTFETGYNFNLIFDSKDLNSYLNINQLLKKLKGIKNNSNIKIYKNCIKNIFHFLKIKRKDINIQFIKIKNDTNEEKILVSINIDLKDKEKILIISNIKYYSMIEKHLFILFNNII